MSWWMWGILIEFCALILVFLFLEGAFGDHRKRRERRPYSKEAIKKAGGYANEHRG